MTLYLVHLNCKGSKYRVGVKPGLWTLDWTHGLDSGLKNGLENGVSGAGLNRSDGKEARQSDYCALEVWDATCPDTFAPSQLIIPWQLES